MNKKVVIVTGATGGIGKAIATVMVDNDCFVVLVDLNEVAGSKLEKSFQGNAKFIKCDITNENDVAGLYTFVIDNYKKFDTLINSAGIVRDNLIWKMSPEDFDLVIDVNLKGTWLMCREAAKLMKEQKSGRIVNIASRAWLGNAGQSNYSASKAGIVGLTRVLALELGRYNVLVNAVAPGLIDTPMTQSLAPEVLEKLILAQPTKNMGHVNDVARVVEFLCNEKTQFITGQTIYVDGGKSIGGGL